MSLIETTEVSIERRAGVLWVTLSRPEAFNAISPGILAGLETAIATAETDMTVRALVITGQGKAFCAGADLKAIPSGNNDAETALAMRHFLNEGGLVFNRLEKLRVPVIGAVNGIALAGGVEILLCCDYVVADPGAKLGEGHAKFGQIPGGGGSARLPRRIGASRAKYLMFTGEVLSAADAAACGLVDEVAPPGKLLQRVEDIVGMMVEKSGIVLERMKALVAESLDQPLDMALRSEIAMSAWHAASHDRNEGLAAFAAKRAPDYQGR